MNSYLSGRVKTKPAYHAEALPQFRGTSRLMLTDPLIKLGLVKVTKEPEKFPTG